MSWIFISYRRGEFREGVYHELPLGSVGRLADRLNRTYGHRAVFLDSDDIGAGAIFDPQIRKELARTKVLLVVIGPRWAEARGPDDGPRLHSPDDWVRQEVELGLARTGVLVVPVLVDGATLPTRDQLPSTIHGLLDRNSVALRDGDTTYEADFEKLTRAIGGRRGILRFAPAIGAVAVVLAVVAGLLVWQRGGGSDQVASAPAADGSIGSSSSGTGSTTTTTIRPRESMPFSTFNVAVAEFTSADPADSGAARSLAEEFARTLQRSLGSNGTSQTVTVWGPDETGRLPGATEAERSAAARELATEVNASVVIGGRVELAGSTSVVNPVATLNPRRFPASPELGGSWPLGPLSSTVGAELVDDLGAAAGGVAAFMQGVGYYERVDGDPESASPDAPVRPGSAEQNRARARSAFEAALATEGLPDTVKAAAHTFLGSLALLGTEADLTAAQQEFDQALRLDPASTRARLGRAEVTLQRSNGDGCATVDGAGLEEAAAAFAAIARTGTDPATTAIKARLGQARALRCLSQAGLGDHFGEAEGLLERVVADAEALRKPEGDVDPLREWTAAAHAELALTIAPAVGPNPDRTGLEAALEASLAETQKAIDKTRRDQNKAVFLWQKAFYLKQLDDLKQTGDTHDAEEALAAAAKLDPTFSSLQVGSLTPPATGRFVPWSGGGQPSPTVAVLPMTGDEVFRQFTLALGLLGAGFLLTSIAKRRRLGC